MPRVGFIVFRVFEHREEVMRIQVDSYSYIPPKG